MFTPLDFRATSSLSLCATIWYVNPILYMMYYVHFEITVILAI